MSVCERHLGAQAGLEVPEILRARVQRSTLSARRTSKAEASGPVLNKARTWVGTTAG
jgi:hypothetical protein